MIEYQIGVFDPGGECWRFYRDNFEIVTFTSLEDAESVAMKLSQKGTGKTAFVFTLHACFKTETEYPAPPEPIRRTQRIEIEMRAPKRTEP